MGGVDLSDQMVSLYDLDRKSKKWWVKVYFRVVMSTAYNAYVVVCDVHHKKYPFLQFLISLAEDLIDCRRSKLPIRRMQKAGRPAKRAKFLTNVGGHFPIKEKSCRQCIQCTSRKREKRTNYMCKCNIPLCIERFAVYHT